MVHIKKNIKRKKTQQSVGLDWLVDAVSTRWNKAELL